MSTAPWASAALALREAEWTLNHHEYLERIGSPTHDAAGHAHAREELLALLAELIAAALLTRARLLPPAAAEGDAPPAPAGRPVPKIVSESIHG